MKFVNAGGRAALLDGNSVFDLERASGGTIASDPMTVLTTQWQAAQSLSVRGAVDGGIPLSEVRLGPPVPKPGAIFGLVANYPPAQKTALPMVFAKSPSAVAGPNDSVVLPDPRQLPMRQEWTVLEAELAFVVGRGGRHLNAHESLDSLAGYMIAQDITERMHEFGPTRSSVGTMEYASLKTLGKSFDTFCPIGPAIVTLDEFDDPADLLIECRLNGALVQKASTQEMLVSVPELVALLSTFVTLRPGDVCLTGTPTPLTGSLPRLRDGDTIQTEISGLGTLRNKCLRA